MASQKFFCKFLFLPFTVCIKTVDKIDKLLDDKDRKDEEKIEAKIRKFCKKATNKEERFVSMHFICL